VQERNQVSSILWAVGGTIWGLFTAVGSLFLAGGGHGWVSALPFGILAIVAAPLTAVAWARRKTNGRELAKIAVVISVVANALLLVATLGEGTQYFFRALPMALAWIVVWCSWQVVAVVVLLNRPPGANA